MLNQNLIMRRKVDRFILWDILLGNWLGLFTNINTLKDQKIKVYECSKLDYGDWQLNDGVLNPKMKERRREGKGERKEEMILKGIWRKIGEI